MLHGENFVYKNTAFTYFPHKGLQIRNGKDPPNTFSVLIKVHGDYADVIQIQWLSKDQGIKRMSIS